MDRNYHAVRRCNYIIQTTKSSSAADIVSKAVRKMQAHNRNFCSGVYLLHYPDGTVVDTLLEDRNKKFTLQAYKEELQSDYCKVKLFIRRTQSGMNFEHFINC